MITRIYVGVDISKNWFDVCASLDENTPVERYSNHPDGHAKFIKAVSGLARKIHVCMEYTGGYEIPLALAAREAGFIVSLIDGGKFSTYRKSFGRATAKTDKQDARRLARYAKERRPAQWFPVPDEYRTLRELVRHRQDLLQAKAAWGNRATHTVENELVTAQRMALTEVLTVQIEDLDKEIQAHIESRSSLKEAMDLLVSIPGIAKVAAARIIAETGPISNYSSPKEYALAAGLSPIVIHSGQKTPPGKLPVYGNAELRCALYFPALVCKGHKIGVWKFMQGVQANGDKVKMTIITAGMRKLAHIIYGVLVSKTKFDPDKM
jgi:transposase